jgi:hypothetical protein
VCPDDEVELVVKERDLTNIPKNIALFKIIQAKKKNSSFKDPEFEMSNISKNEEANSEEAANDDTEAQDLVNALTFPNSIG